MLILPVDDSIGNNSGDSYTLFNNGDSKANVQTACSQTQRQLSVADDKEVDKL
jgi:hypothetical protein